jgi:hypothetical protein
MPLVISEKSKSTHYIDTEEILGEILGHSDFEGRDWAVGDLIVFEDGTRATLERFPREQFHTWSEPTPMEVGAAVLAVQKYGDPRLPPESDVPTFDRLFFLMSQPLPYDWRRELIGTAFLLFVIGLIVAGGIFAFSK